MRIGLGFDVHRFVEGRRLVLGGVPVFYEKGLAGHSDGDAVCHALADALLSAAGLPDIGELFPDTDPRYKDYDSTKILAEAVKMVRVAGFRVESVDIVVICEKPRLHPYKDEIIDKLKEILGRDVHVGLKGKTAEGLGEIGREEALAVYAVALLAEDGNNQDS